MAKNKELKLKVTEALQDDAYKGIARLDVDLMKEIDVKRGDPIMIVGQKSTVAIADRSYPADIGEGIIRIDGLLRRNAGVSIGDEVKITRAEVKEAKRIVIAPSQKGIMVQGDGDSLRRGLLGRTLSKGDIVSLGGAQRRRDLMGEDMGDLNDIFGNLGDILGGMGFANLGGATQLKFTVVTTTPNCPVVVTENTEVILNNKAVESIGEGIPTINYEDIGGLTEEIKKIREMIEVPMKHPEIFQKLGIQAPKGVLLYGPPGTGKTLLAKAVATETDAHFKVVNGPEIFNKFYGESEKKIRTIFEEAEKSAPSIIFIDELDAVAPNRDSGSGQGEVERRVVSQLLTMMDGLNSRGRVIVVAATNRIDSIDPALRRPGRFDREIEINVPNREGRLAILKIHTRGMPLKGVKLEEIASLTHGFVGADLEALAKEAAINVLRKNINKIKIDDETISPEILEKLIIRHEDFLEALKFVRPSAMREVFVEKPTVGWESIGGLDRIKEDLKEAVEWPLNHSESFKRMGIRPSKGILLYGPPGTGKTLLAKAVAKESQANFIQIKGPELQKEGIVGKETERLRKIFNRARQVSPCVILFDELDSIAKKRGGTGSFADSNESLLNTLLSEMDGIDDLKNVLVVATTNRPDMLDTALLRPGRFDKILLVNAPTVEGRENILKIHTKNMPLAKDVKIKEIAKEIEGFTGADIEALVREAGMVALRESMDSEYVTKKHFTEAMKKVKPSVTKQSIEIYKKIEDKFLNNAKSAIVNGGSYLG